MDTLLDAVRRYTQLHADADGAARSPISGLTLIRATAPSGLLYDISRPLVCLVLQGSKQITTGTRTVSFTAGDSLLIAADVPTVSQITQASIAAHYFSLALVLDPAIIADLTAQMDADPNAHPNDPSHTQPPGHPARSNTGLDAGPEQPSPNDGVPLHVQTTDSEVADAALRMMRLLDRPAAVPVLQAQLVREMHYWLLAGKHGPAIRRLGWPEGHVQRVARAVSILRAEYAQPIAIDRLAAEAGMSPSSFHQHFRAVTSLSPLQFQKHLRLIEARRLMLADGVSASSAAFKVGYESVSQFTREYRRSFGQPPVRDTRLAKDRLTLSPLTLSPLTLSPLTQAD